MTLDVRTPDSVEALSHFTASLRFEDLPSELVDLTKQTILDTLGVALAASGIGEGCHEIVEFVTAQGGTAEATVWSNGRRVPASAAALANGTLARALDYDDIIESPQAHVAVCVVPTAFAIAEQCSAPVSGRDFLTAVAIGCEVQHRLAVAMARGQDPNVFPALLPTQIFGYFSAAAAAGRLLGLTPAKMQSAFGLALMQAAGTEELVVHSTESVGKCIYAAFSNQGGTQSALLAARGVLAHGAIFDGQAGLFGAHYDGHYDRTVLTDRLGETFLAVNRCFKFWPGTLISHPFIEAALELVETHALTPDDIAEVRARVGVWGRAMCEPLEMRRRPPTSAAAMNSVPFIVAKVLVNRTLTLADFKGVRREQPEVLAMAARVTYEFDPALNNPNGLEPGLLEIRTRQGQTFSARVERPRGHPSRPLSFDDVAVKFRQNAAYAATPPNRDRSERLVACTRRLETLANVREIVDCLVG